MWKLLLIVCAVTAVTTAANVRQPKQNSKTPFDFDDFMLNRFGQRVFGGTWISGSEFTFTSSGNFVKHNLVTGENSTILTSAYIESQRPLWGNSVSYRVSPDLTKILVRYAPRQIFRHSTVAKFSLINLNNLEQEQVKIDGGGELQIAFFSPTGNSLAYIESNNIYYLDLETYPPSLPTVITTDGTPGVIYNGVPDWVYEEEVLGTDAASWFSPDGKNLAFVRFDDELVKEAVYDIYGEGDRQYPEEVHLRYPKAGTTNPTVQLFLVDLQTTINRRELAIPTTIVGADHILGTVFWINDSALGAIWMNRRQNSGVFVSYDATTLAMTTIIEINEPSGWIDVNTPKCDANSCYFVNNFNNWPTLTRVDLATKAATQLSSPGMNVISFYGVKDGSAYFVSTPAADKPFNRHVYMNGGSGPTCLTCNVKRGDDSCSYATTSFSRDMSYYVMTCSGPNPSFVKIFKTGAEEIMTWEENLALRTSLEQKIMPQVKTFFVDVGGGFKAAVKMQLPPQIDFEGKDETTKYPMQVRVYGGPGSNRVQETFGIGYQTYQVTTKNIIFVEIDGRGTSLKGLDMMFSINNRLGTYEAEDQVAVAKYLVDTYKFIDPERVGIWGWSYGGYATAMALAKDTEKVFKCGISVAPVTSWRFYDTIYTERYMGTDQNATNYIVGDVSTEEHVKNIGNHEFFLIHGNADDNVHYQNSMVLARALEKADINFDQLSYPNEAHSISGTQRHLYHAFDRFWDTCFKA